MITLLFLLAFALSSEEYLSVKKILNGFSWLLKFGSFYHVQPFPLFRSPSPSPVS